MAGRSNQSTTKVVQPFDGRPGSEGSLLSACWPFIINWEDISCETSNAFIALGAPRKFPFSIQYPGVWTFHTVISEIWTQINQTMIFGQFNTGCTIRAGEHREEMMM